MEKCKACRGIECEQGPEGLEILDIQTNIITVRPEESLKQCPTRNKLLKRSEIVYEKGVNK